MILEAEDRRRMVLAAMLTVAALPFLWSSKRDQAAGSDTPLGALGPAGGIAVGSLAPATDSLMPELIEPAFLGGTATTLPPQPIMFDVAAAPTGQLAVGLAGFRGFSAGQTAGERHPCATTLAPFGTRITVTNTDNGYRVACVNVSVRTLDPGEVIVLETSTFGELADQAEAPIAVEISW